MVRRLDTKLYLVALVATIVIFSIGIYVGLVISKEKVSYLESSLRESEQDFERYQTIIMLQDNLPERSCDILSYRSQQLVPKISELGAKLENYDRTKKFEHPEKFEDLREDYTLLYIRYWLQMKKMREECDTNITTMLYLFDAKNCSSCEPQGKILDYWKKQYEKSLLIFPLAVDLELDSVKMIQNAYNINELPAMIINENQTYEGFKTQQEIGRILREAKGKKQ